MVIELDKNGFKHSERLENYLDYLTKDIRNNNKITSIEIFILLCATYMHDVGYKVDEKIIPEGHAERSQEMILKNPILYHLNDFPVFDQKYPRIAEAIGFVCLGHKIDIKNDNLNLIPDEFQDSVFWKSEYQFTKDYSIVKISRRIR